RSHKRLRTELSEVIVKAVSYKQRLDQFFKYWRRLIGCRAQLNIKMGFFQGHKVFGHFVISLIQTSFPFIQIDRSLMRQTVSIEVQGRVQIIKDDKFWLTIRSFL